MPAESCLTMLAPVGRLLLCARHNELTRLVILADRTDEMVMASARQIGGVAHNSPVLQQAQAQLSQYFAGRRREFQLPLALAGLPPFTRTILEILQSVAFGETITYGALAAKAGFPRAARAVGGAMAANPLTIVIPCHRVVAVGGRPGGYSGGEGLPTKEWLLTFERNNCRENPADFQEKLLDSRARHLLNRGPHFG